MSEVTPPLTLVATGSPGSLTLGQRIKAFRFLPIDTYPGVIEFVQQPMGKVLLLALFGLALIPTGRAIMAVPIVIAAGA